MDRRPLFGGKPDSTSFVERLARPAVFGACFRVGLFHLELFVKIQQNVENWNVSVLDVIWSAVLLQEGSQAFSSFTLFALVLIILGIGCVNKEETS